MMNDGLALGHNPAQEIALLKAELEIFRRQDALKLEIQTLRDRRLDDRAAACSIYNDLQIRYQKMQTIYDSLEESQKNINRWKAARINALVATKCHEEQDDSESLNSDDYSMCDMEEIISEQRDYADDNAIAKELGIITEGIQHIHVLNKEIRDFTNEMILLLTVEL